MTIQFLQIPVLKLVLTISLIYATSVLSNEEDVELIAGAYDDSCLYRMKLDGTNKFKVPGISVSNFRSVAYSVGLDQIFASTDNYPLVKRGFLNNDTTLKPLGNKITPMAPISIATDSSGYKLYIADNAIGKISIFDLRNGKEHFIPLYEYRQRIEGISLDSSRGLLFVAVESDLIIRMGMDGSEKKIIHTNKGQVWGALQVYEKKQKLFVVGSNSIRTMNYDGTEANDVLQHHRDSGFTTLDIFEDKFFWTDEQFVKFCQLTSDFRCLEGSMGQFNISRFPTSTGDVNPIKIIQHERKKADDNPCNEDNGGCKDLCLEKPLANDRVGSRCACDVTWELMADGKSCRKAEEFLLFRSETCVIGGYSFSDIQDGVMYPKADGVMIVIDYDYREGVVFYTQQYKKICRRKIYLPDEEYCFQWNAFSNTLIEKISYDWRSKNLYYLENNHIVVTPIDIKIDSKAIYSESYTNKIKDLIVYPPEESVYFLIDKDYLTLGHSTSIVRMTNNGSDSTDIVKSSSREFSIQLLTIDFSEHHIYWLENRYTDFNIGRVNLDGKEQISFPVLLKENSNCKLPKSMTIHDEYLFLACKEIGVLKIDKSTGKNIELFVEGDIYEVKTFSAKAQP